MSAIGNLKNPSQQQQKHKYLRRTLTINIRTYIKSKQTNKTPLLRDRRSV